MSGDAGTLFNNLKFKEMEIKTKHIGAYSGNPASIIELIITADNAVITEEITSFNTTKVDVDFIEALKELIEELEEHNSKVDIVRF